MRKVLLCVLDGVGESKKKEGNAFLNAKTSNIDKIKEEYGYKLINASGKYVGLPDGQMGNSEVGHLTLGCGRIIYQPLALINKEIKENKFIDNKAILNAINHSKKNNSKLHIMGLLSDGGVHSHIDHFKEILRVISLNNFNNVYFHIFTDGRDTNVDVSKKYLDELQKEIDNYGVGKIVSISGRYYGMDRDKRYDRIEEAYNTLVYKSIDLYDDYKSLIDDNYKKDITDEFIKPSVIDNDGIIESNDSIIWVNFRPDRSIELLDALTNKDFDGFKTKKLKNIYLTTMMYISDNINSDIIVKMEEPNNTLGVYLSKLGMKQLRIAETEKYAHVTYFFDGLKDLNLKGCRRILVPSKKVTTYDLAPEMSAYEIKDALLKEMNNNYDFILLNFANCDMVGHTGNYDATIKAVETVDKCIGEIYEKCMKEDYLFIITADHGNCEMMTNNDKIVTSHTTNKVPFIVCDKLENTVDKLSDVAPFILNVMNLKIPDEMK